ncbi:hypothetical protein PDESU_01553 [Pontiella desulfatans]|uniref:Sialate O-acetylesterase domain-containing protein n=1 Tax=Pontiella desulfatans TaxID=2750659 RepID=A0A6C2TZK0_PONDE|nr:sialate O-acetylesterase [Pontiella desulfatans]VGO12999.1 hypothetical protein PDESU_01553 [Pontiella desulfatans]
MKKIIGSLLLGLCVQAQAVELEFAPIFNEGAVLQCEIPVNIWGTADPGETVTVSFAEQKKTAQADAHGKWMLQLDPMNASSDPRTLAASSTSNQQLTTIHNVVVGEVWLATGQSNMHQPARVTKEGREALKRVHSKVHFSKVPLREGAPHIPPCTKEELSWGKFGPAHNQLAAVAFHFAEELQPKVGKHVGVIQCSYGGTPIESWMPEEALQGTRRGKWVQTMLANERKRGLSADELKKEMADYDAAKAAKTPNLKQPVGNPFYSKTPAALYESMTKEIIPYTARGVLWYQGEANAARPDEYVELLSAHIGRMREDFQCSELPFYIVQLSAWGPGEKYWPAFRVAQGKVRDTVPHTGLALSLDKGDKTDIHPTDKKPVGQRLAYLALNEVYGVDTPSRGPMLKAAKPKGTKMILTFDYALDGLKTMNGSDAVTGFEIAGSDNQFVAADARITGANEITLSAASVARPQFARYAWNGFFEPALNLYNAADLPAEPFQYP